MVKLGLYCQAFSLIKEVMAVHNPHLAPVVDQICNKGCSYVNSVLKDSDVRAECNELKTLSDQECQEVLKELDEVMAVYNQTGSCEI